MMDGVWELYMISVGVQTHLPTNLNVLFGRAPHGHGRCGMVPAQLLEKCGGPLGRILLELGELVWALKEGDDALLLFKHAGCFFTVSVIDPHGWFEKGKKGGIWDVCMS